VVEVIGAVDSRGDVAVAHRVEQVVGAVVVPAVPGVQVRRNVGCHLRIVGPREHNLFTRADIQRFSARRRDGRHSTPAGDEGGRVLIYVRAVVPRTIDGEGGLRSVDLNGLPGAELAEVEGDLSRRDPDLLEFGLVVVESDLGFGPAAYEGPRTDLDFEVGSGSPVEAIARGEWSVDPGWCPVLGARSPVRYLTVEVAQSGRCNSCG
jgi:hypothetical protein